MLKMNEEQMDVFGHIQYISIKSEIDNALTISISGWKELNLTQKTKWLDFLISKGIKAQFNQNNEFVEFSEICMSAEEGCQNFLKRMDVKNIILDKYLSGIRKLTLLQNLKIFN